MAKIPGKILILAGVGVILLSLLFNFLKKTNRFNLFIIISVVIVIWGLVSLYFEKKQEQEEQKDSELEQKIIKQTVTQSSHQTHHVPHHKTHHNIIVCHNCGLKHYSHANYCQRCGSKLNKLSRNYTKDL